jgi:hypothetical protein
MAREYHAGEPFPEARASNLNMRLRPLKAGSLVRVKLDNGRVIEGHVKAVRT